MVVGVGGTGFYTAYDLAMSGCEHLVLFDTDYIEETNLNRLPFKASDLGRPKTQATKDFIQAIRPDCTIDTEGMADDFTLELHKDCSVLFDCTDRVTTQRMLYNWCKTNKVEYIRVGYDGTHITAGVPPPTWSTTGEVRTGYEITPSWVVPASMVANLAVMKVMMYPEFTYAGDIGQITVGSMPKTTRQVEWDRTKAEFKACSESFPMENCDECYDCDSKWDCHDAGYCHYDPNDDDDEEYDEDEDR